MKQVFQKILDRFVGNTKPNPPELAVAPPAVSIAKFRKPTWEEDISLNHDSELPFENAPAPCNMPPESFEIWSNVTEELLDGKPLQSFIARDQFPIPHARDREGYQVNYDARYFLNGLADYLSILKAIQRHGVAPGGQPVGSFLDFGCASGRVLRQFCAHSEIKNLWGCDINGRHVQWMNDNLPSHLKIIHSHCLSHLPIASNSLDVISAFSVFTHIDTFETGWLSELHRILKPGGMVYLTVHNDATWKHLQNANTNSADDYLLNRLCQVDADFRDRLSDDIPGERTVFRYTDVRPYRALTFHSNAYLEKTWGRFFKVAEVVPMGHGICQSVFIGLKT